MNTELYWIVRGSYAERKAKLAELSRDHLEAAILDSGYNKFIQDRADYASNDEYQRCHGKRVPYIGWFWRHIQFSDPTSIPIGDGGEFIGFMANNKWDYPERTLTAEEAENVIKIIDEAIHASQQSGNMASINAAVNTKLDELWEYMQTLKV